MTEPITDELVDRAYEAMTDELEFWRIIGPDNQGAFVALRDPEIQMKLKAAAVIMPNTGPETATLVNYRLRDKAHAVACLQWHALKAALAAVKGELGPIPSNEDGNDNG